MKFSALIFALLLMASSAMAATHVAVLETISENGIIGRSEKIFLTDKLRERAKAVLPAYKGYIVMTRENINAMLPPGKSIEECEGSCLVETGKNIAADYVAQARVGKFGKQLTLTMELYETAGNNLVGSFTVRKRDAEGLLEEIEREADRFFAQITGMDVLTTSAGENNKENISKGIFVDKRDGKKYKTMTMGKQIWMAENLDYELDSSFCYNNQESNCAKYGRLYTWKSAKKACPSGWHLPNVDEIEALLKSAGEKMTAGKFLKSTANWNINGNGSDTFGFSALPAGNRNFNGNYYFEGYSAFFWSSTEKAEGYAYNMVLVSGNDQVNLNSDNWLNGLSVRCVKNDDGLAKSATEGSKDVVGGNNSTGILVDKRDGKTYKTKTIHNQTWMAENLNYKTRDSYCYKNNESNCSKYGRLYEWKSAKKVCPSGWHLPSKAEFVTLFNSIGGVQIAGKQLKSKKGWNRDGNGTDAFGFSALPAGGRSNDGNFDSEGKDAVFWSFTEYGSDGAYGVNLYYGDDDAYLDYINKYYGFSVRCLKD